MKVGNRVWINSAGQVVKPADLKFTIKGVIIDMKWNMCLIRFDDGRTDWVPAKTVNVYG